MRCDGSPDPTVPGEINTYINLRLEDSENNDIDSVMKQGQQDIAVSTVKILKLRTQKNCCNYPKVGTMSFYYREMDPKDADRMANNVDPDQKQSDLGLHCLPRPLWPKT